MAALLLAFSFQAFAQNGTIILKNGDEYKGYVAKQTFGNEAEATIRFTQMIINVDMSSQKNVVSEKVRLSDLSEEWQKWVSDNEKTENYGDEKVVTLSTMSIQGYERMKYYVLERGTKYSKCITLTPGQVQCKMSDIYCFLKASRATTLLTDIDDIVTTKTGNFTGIMLEQYPGKQMKIWDKSDKGIHVVNADEVLFVGKAAFNPELSLWCQTPVLERLQTKEGYYSEYGLLTKYGTEMTLMTKTTTQLFKLSDVLSIERIDNPDYSPSYDIILGPDEVVINRDKKLSFVDFVERTYSNTFSLYVMDSAKEKDLTVVTDASVSIETSLSGISGVNVFEAKLRDVTVSRKEKMSMWSYSFEDMYRSTVTVEQNLSMNGTSKIDFTLPAPGIYVVFIKSLGRAWVIKYDPSAKVSPDVTVSGDGLVVVGDKKLLKKAGIPQNIEDIDASKINRKYALIVDKATCNEIKLSSPYYQILSTVPEESIDIAIDKDGNAIVKILNPDKFWSNLDCFVIQLM